MSKRIETHRIDTKAVRTIFTHLSEHWLVRSLEERDYGIDLQLERFDSDDATGDFIFVQVKGTDSAFEGDVKLSFPVETINYALMFDVPFFVFHTSNKSRQTKFVWLQKYVELKLESENPQWKSQGHVTIYFPEENDLQSNDEKIAEIIKKDKSRKVGVKFLSDYEALSLHAKSVISGQYAVASACAALVRKLYKLSSFIDDQKNTSYFEGFTDFNSLAEAFDNISKINKIDNADKDTLRSGMKFLEDIKFSFLSSDDLDAFALEQQAYFPY
ncbi:DUF4365 domain-containing protein [Janthinobacterium sp. RB2P8]|uniref:DUF4365 domain-containing protein n=1 Tax=Janthinobacterium sp. RB2P8 TaxID=3424191 RepID=UPI003F24EEA6